MDSIDFIEVNTNKQPSSCVIWLHGLGANGHDFKDIVSELKIPKGMGIRFIFPHAPIQPVTINAGYPMRSWFDILGLDVNAKQDEIGIRKSQRSIEHLINNVICTGIPSQRIILGGFSQGGAMALHIALRLPQKLAGMIGLSTFLPLADLLHVERHTMNEKTAIFLAHGRQDSVVPFAFGKMGFDLLRKLGYVVSWHEYNLPHSVNAQEVADVSAWIQKILS
jgi:phospholipase/carboxylesterase